MVNKVILTREGKRSLSKLMKKKKSKEEQEKDRRKKKTEVNSLVSELNIGFIPTDLIILISLCLLMFFVVKELFFHFFFSVIVMFLSISLSELLREKIARKKYPEYFREVDRK